MDLTQFLLSLGVDMSDYVYWIEGLCYDRVETIVTWHKIGVPDEDIIEKNSEWRLNLPNLVSSIYPTLTPYQVETTCMIINDCIQSEYYLDCLFASFNKAEARQLGVELITERFNLQLTGAQLN